MKFSVGIVLFLLMILSCVVVYADTEHLYASDSTYACAGDWINVGNAYDENWVSYAYPDGFSAGVCNFTYSTAGKYVNSAVYEMRAGGIWTNLSVPASCLRVSPMKFVFAAALDPYHNSTWWGCVNGTDNYIQIGSAGTGLSNGNFIQEQALHIDYDPLNVTPPNPAVCIPTAACTWPNCYYNDDFFFTNETCSFEDVGYLLFPYRPGYVPEVVSVYDVIYHGFVSNTETDIVKDILNTGHYANNLNDTFIPFFWGCADFGYPCVIEHSVEYLDAQEGQYRKPYVIVFVYDVDSLYADIFVKNPDNSSTLICDNCIYFESPAPVTISSYNYEDSGFTFYNSTSHQRQNYPLNSYQVFYNGVNVSGFLPQYQPLTPGHSNLLTRERFFLHNHAALLGLSLNRNALPFFNNTTPTPVGLRAVGEPCLNPVGRAENNSLCWTGKCRYGKCEAKYSGEACLQNYECLSNRCVGNFCTDAGTWVNIEASKDSMFGGDIMTSNFISIVIMIVSAGMIAVGTGGNIFGIALGIGVFYVEMLFFTIVGWLSPFILLGGIMLGLILFVFGFLASQRGN